MTIQELKVLEALLKKALLAISTATGYPYTEVTLMDDLSGTVRAEGYDVMFDNIADFLTNECEGSLSKSQDRSAQEIARNMLILAEDRDYQGFEFAADNYRSLLIAYRKLQAEVDRWAEQDMNDPR